MTIPICGIHHSEMKWKEGGTSKTTGKPYNGFWSCGTKDEQGNWCSYKPPKQEATPVQKFESSLNTDIQQNRIDKAMEAKRNGINASVGLNNAVQYYQGKNVMPENILEVATKFKNWLDSNT